MKLGLLSAAIALSGAGLANAQERNVNNPNRSDDVGVRDDRGFPWGLLGLIGLAGLAGLAKREHRDAATYGRTSTAGAR